MKILREFLEAYLDRTAAYRERTRASFGGDVAEANVAITGVVAELPEEDDPWQDWLDSFGRDLEPSDLEEVLWARGKMSGTEPRGTTDEARGILQSRMVPRSAWRAPSTVA